MKKIPNLFKRDWNGDRSRVLPELNPDADVAWVLAGEGNATVKWDGSACLVRDGELYVRFDAKRGKTPPADFEPCQEEDPVTGHRPGWIPADGPAAKWHVDAFVNSRQVDRLTMHQAPVLDGTYEACGPQHQSNPYNFPRNILIKHGADPCSYTVWKRHVPVGEVQLFHGWITQPSAKGAHAYLTTFLAAYHHQHPEMPAPMPIEGIVWHHLDGRMVKVLASDLGVPWKAKARA